MTDGSAADAMVFRRMLAVWGIAVASFALHVICNGRYGNIHDESIPSYAVEI